MDFATMDADQVLWTEALECLGYSKNRKLFRQLKARVTWRMLAYPVQVRAILAPCCGKEPDLTLRAAAVVPD